MPGILFLYFSIHSLGSEYLTINCSKSACWIQDAYSQLDTTNSYATRARGIIFVKYPKIANRSDQKYYGDWIEISILTLVDLSHWGSPRFNTTKDQRDNIYLKSSGLVN